MIDFVMLIIIGSLVCWGVYGLFLEGNLLFKVRQIIEPWLPMMIRNPLYECYACMASIWGTVTWVVMGQPMNWHLIIYLLALSGLNRIIR